MVQSNEFFEALRAISQQARRIETPEEATLLAFRQISEDTGGAVAGVFALTDAAPTVTERGLTYTIDNAVEANRHIIGFSKITAT
ncbi:MAG TPA: hypothetical protein VI855_06985 [Dehalococcoidia bacterium]|nr:hypothetical protein [Dehalococcoidia bacterium]